MFVDNDARVVFDKFSERLVEIEGEIKERNQVIEVPYTVLLPSKIPNGISV